MAFQIRKRFSFSAAHQLEGLPPEHPCSRLHGHNYEVEVLLEGELNEFSFVRDYRDLDAFKRYLDENLDHRNLNEVLSGQTSAENIARYLYAWCRQRWPEVVAIEVSETPKTWALYYNVQR